MDQPPVRWSPDYYTRPEAVRGKVVRCDVDVPLSTVAFLHRAGASDVEFAGTLSAAHSSILWEEVGAWQRDPDTFLDPAAEPLLVNACTTAGFTRAGAMGAQGVGLARGEFLFAVALADMLDLGFVDGRTVVDVLVAEGESRTLGRVLLDQRLRGVLYDRFEETFDAAGKSFDAGAPVFVRCFDYGDAYGVGGGEQRGTSLLLDRMPEAIGFLVRALADANARHETRFVFGLPLVSSYTELAAVQRIAREAGVVFDGTAASLGFGWEIETPAASLCTGLWADHLAREFGTPVTLCGIGTNDLTQYTLARSRRDIPRPTNGRHEAHPAVLALLTRLAEDCQARSLTAVLSGDAANDPGYRAFARELGFLVSCTIPALGRTQQSGTPVLDQAVSAEGLTGVAGLAEAIGTPSRTSLLDVS